jgi:hypothetical protein
VKKERKHYHYDWTLVPDPPKRFENFIASHLWKWVHYLEDTQGREMELRYFRDVDGREVDFVLMENSNPILFIECKWSDDPISQPLRYLQERFPGVASWQIHATGKKDYQSSEKIRVAPAHILLNEWI